MSGRHQDPKTYLKRIGKAGSGPHDIAGAALMLAAFDHPERKLDPFLDHLGVLAATVHQETEYARDAEEAARALSGVLAGRYGYDGEQHNYDDPANADLISVIERRRGMPVALGILYMHAARGAGFKAQGLNTPGHFLLALTVRSSEVLVDPFNAGAVVSTERLAGPPLLSEYGLPGEPAVLEPVSDTDVLLRLQNNIKVRALEHKEPVRAIEILSRMLLIAPDRAGLWLELGRLQEGAGVLSSARNAYEQALSCAAKLSMHSNEAALALASLKRRLN